MPLPSRLALPLLLAALLGGCALARPAPAPETRASPFFAGIGGVDVLVFTDLPDDYVAPRGLRSLEIGARVRARLAAAGVPLRPDSVPFDMGRPNVRLDLTSLHVAPDEYAVWARVAIGETVRLPRRSDLPLLITSWSREGKLVVHGDEVAPLWREIDRLTDEFIREYHVANRAPERRG